MSVICICEQMVESECTILAFGCRALVILLLIEIDQGLILTAKQELKYNTWMIATAGSCIAGSCVAAVNMYITRFHRPTA